MEMTAQSFKETYCISETHEILNQSNDNTTGKDETMVSRLVRGASKKIRQVSARKRFSRSSRTSRVPISQSAPSTPACVPRHFAMSCTDVNGERVRLIKMLEQQRRELLKEQEFLNRRMNGQRMIRQKLMSASSLKSDNGYCSVSEDEDDDCFRCEVGGEVLAEIEEFEVFIKASKSQ